MTRNSRLRRPVWRFKLLIASAVVAFVVLAGGAAAAIHTYFGPGGAAEYGVRYASAYNEMQWNRVYRPVGFWFTLYYSDDQFAYQYERNWWDNPFWHNNPGGYRRSVCIHSDHDWPYPIDPTTCQYGT